MARATDRRIWVVIILLIGFALLPSIYTASYHSQGNASISVDNETWTPNTGVWVELDENDTETYALDNETVYNSSGVKVNESVDYEFSTGNISIKAVSGGALDGEPSANITYTAKHPYNSTRAIHSGLAVIVNNVVWIVGFVVAAAALGMFARLEP